MVDQLDFVPVTARQALEGLDAADWGVLEQLGRALHVQEAALVPTLDAVLHLAVELIPPAAAAGVNLLDDGRFEPQAVLGGPPHELDALQQRTGVGPCVSASREQAVMVVADTCVDDRWPEFAALAAGLGVRSMLCVPMWVDATRLGSVSLYGNGVDPFTPHHARLAELLATHAALALADAHRTGKLRAMAHNRDIIGQAKGVLMERHKITADAAFARLRDASQRSNRKLIVVATELVETGALQGSAAAD